MYENLPLQELDTLLTNSKTADIGLFEQLPALLLLPVVLLR